MKAKIISITKEEAKYIGVCDCCDARIKATQKMLQITVEWDYPVHICRDCANNFVKMFKEKE